MGLESGGVNVKGVRGSVVALEPPDKTNLRSQWDAFDLGLTDGDPISTFPDSEGSNDAGTSGTTPTFVESAASLNSNPAANCQSGQFTVSSFDASVSQPYAIFTVLNSDNTSFIHDGDDGGDTAFLEDEGSGYRIFAGSNVSGGSSQQGSAAILGAVFDGSNSEIRINGTQVATGNVGSRGQAAGSSFGIMGKNSSSGDTDGHFGEMLFYDGATNYGEVESYLSSKWGITI